MKRLSAALQTTLLGALGGFLGFVLSEVLVSHGDSETAWAAVLGTAWWTALLVLPLALVLTAGENLLGLRGKWSRGLGRVIVPALLLGAVAGGLAQVFYALGLSMDAPRRLMRALGWAFMGAGVGLLLGLGDRSVAKAARGLLGGFVGGFLGGLLFDSFGGLRFGPQDTGVLARLVGLTILGAAIGFMLRLSQELFKSAWLLGTTTGKYEGKQYILAKPVVTVGRSDSKDISFYHDDDVPMQAGEFRRNGQNWRWEGQPIRINGQVQTSAALRPGDRLTFGNTELLFQQKGQVTVDAPYTQPLVLHGNQAALHLPVPLRHVTLGTKGEVHLAGAGVLPQHAEIVAQGETLTLKARGPLRVNEQDVAAGASIGLRPGDLLKIGDTEYALIRSELKPVN